MQINNINLINSPVKDKHSHLEPEDYLILKSIVTAFVRSKKIERLKKTKQ